jgi:haloacetate dehalogenase
LWGARGKIGRWYQPLGVWRRSCDNPAEGGEVASGHYLAEEAPAAVLGEFGRFFQ